MNIIRAIENLITMYKKIGTSSVKVLVMIKDDPHRIVVRISNRLATSFFLEDELLFISFFIIMQYYFQKLDWFKFIFKRSYKVSKLVKEKKIF